jgi:hypothetical protein
MHCDCIKNILLEQIISLVEFVSKNVDRYKESVRQEFKKLFLDTREPHRDSVRDLVSKFRETGSVQDISRRGRPSISTEGKLDDISD